MEYDATRPQLTERDVDGFFAYDLRVGTVLSARPNAGARKPAYVLTIDFGPLGTRTTSAQLTRHYDPEALVGRQVVAVLNFPPRRIAGVASEVLVLGACAASDDVVLLRPDQSVRNGTPIA
jgi:tRNA-binding protein